MLDVSKETTWGLFALHYLAMKSRMAGAAEIARHGRIPLKRLRPILKKLRAAGYVRGRSGHGYALAKAAGAISVNDVAQIFETDETRAKTCTERYDVCSYRESCALAPLCREAWERARSAMRSFTIADLRRAPAALADCGGPGFRRIG
jgi:Rrf2 family protein